jgi:tetratricopeptide (TPR) repeat protein
MKRLVYIAFLFSLVLPGSFSGQQFCTYQVKALEAYQNSEYLIAEKYLDSAFVNCSQIIDDAYSWHIKGFIEKEIYQKVENKDYNSKYREKAIESIKKSVFLDSVDRELEKQNKQVLAYLGATYINDVAALMDTINFKKAIVFYEKYKETYISAKPNFNFNEQEIQYNNSLAGIFEEKFDNNPVLYSEYIDKSISLYKKSLAMDSLNYSANYNLGIIYHNNGVSVIKNMDNEISFEALINSQEKAVEYFTMALPFLKKAYFIQPDVENNLTALAAVYISLHDYESSNMYLEQLNKLKEGND